MISEQLGRARAREPLLQVHLICIAFAFASFVLTPSLAAQPIVGNAEAMDAAKRELIGLESQLRALRSSGSTKIEEAIANVADESARGEFETTDEYEVRIAANQARQSAVEDSLVADLIGARDHIQRQINPLLSRIYRRPLTAILGRYDADREVFPLLGVGLMPHDLKVPRPDAPRLKQQFYVAAKVGRYALLLNEEGVAEEYLLSARVTFDGNEYVSDAMEMRIDRAMAMVFGNYDSVTGRSKWNGPAPGLLNPDRDEWAMDTPLDAIPLLGTTMTESGKVKYVLVVASVNRDSEVDSKGVAGARIGMAIFVRDIDHWCVELAQKNIRGFGQRDQNLRASIVQVGVDRLALRMDGGWDCQQGYCFKEMVLVDRVDGLLVPVLNVATAVENEAASHSKGDDVYFYESTATFLDSMAHGRYDVRVVTAGRRGRFEREPPRMEPFNEECVYRFNGEKYVELPR